MQKKLTIEQFEKELQQENYEQIYQQIIEQSYLLAKEIATFKNLSLEFSETESLSQNLFNIQYDFKQNFACFGDVPLLMQELQDWDTEGFSPEETKVDKIKRLIKIYNRLVEQIPLYQQKMKEVEEKGFLPLKEAYKTRFRTLFHEMLSYKKKPYQEEENFLDLLERIRKSYYHYSPFLDDLRTILFGNYLIYDIEEQPIDLSPTETIIYLEDIYQIFIREGEDYKVYANAYREFELKEGQTYLDLYHEEEKKFVKLFQEMLAYVKKEFHTDDLHQLYHAVLEAYPFYQDTYFPLTLPYPNVSYIEQLDYMETIYENLKKDYPNYEKHMMAYQEKKKAQIEKEENDDERT